MELTKFNVKVRSKQIFNVLLELRISTRMEVGRGFRIDLGWKGSEIESELAVI